MPLLATLLGELADLIVGYLLKEPNAPPIFTTILGKIIPALSQATGETAEQTAARRVAVEAIFAAHAKPIG